MSEREQSSETSGESEEEDSDSTVKTADRELSNRLQEAVREGDVEATKKAIADGASTETVCQEGSVIFNWCMRGDMNMIR